MYLEENYKKIIVEYLKEKTNPILIYLFGLFVKEEERIDSDIDIAVYTDEKIDVYSLFIIGNKLFFKVNRDVQLVDLKDIDTVFAAQIVGTREELYYSDEFAKVNYNTRTFKDYAKLN